MRVAVIGLGTMGAPMARHLIEAGHEVTVHNRTREREEPLAALGAARAATPAEAARAADAVLTCVSDTPDLEHVLLGPGGVAEGLASGGLVVDCSTVSPSATADIAARARASAGIGMVDAPVSGGSEGAEKGTLTIFCGGADADFARAGDDPERLREPDHPPRAERRRPDGQGREPGDDRRHVRQRRRGDRPRAGRRPSDRPSCVEALSAGAAASWVLTNRAGNMIDDSYPLGFKLALHRKDLGIALDEAARAGLPHGGHAARRRAGGRAHR